MPRQKREKSGTGIYHVMLRGINRQDIFEEDEDYLRMLDFLRQQTKRSNCQFLFERYGMTNPLDIQALPKEQRNDLLQALKEFGGGVRQLSRITGVSYGIIQRI
ncbi:MAG: hypothetical protein IJ604_03005 [Prevotella sp.]|nr:hypothetical protein [Prevotella sp.]